MPDAQGRIGAPITVEEANQYIDAHISQFFNSGKYPIKSFIFDAGMLRDYLNAHSDIQNMKFMLGVRPEGTGNNVSTLADLPQQLIKQIEFHFNHYKDLKKPGTTTVTSWGDVDEAKSVIKESIERWNNK